MNLTININEHFETVVSSDNPLHAERVVKLSSVNPLTLERWTGEKEIEQFVFSNIAPSFLKYSLEITKPELELQGVALLSVPDFKALFTISERISIEDKITSDIGVKIFWRDLEDPRLTGVDRNKESVKTAVKYLASKSYITDLRAEEILTT
jgi:hypothetical protein